MLKNREMDRRRGEREKIWKARMEMGRWERERER